MYSKFLIMIFASIISTSLSLSAATTGPTVGTSNTTSKPASAPTTTVSCPVVLSKEIHMHKLQECVLKNTTRDPRLTCFTTTLADFDLDAATITRCKSFITTRIASIKRFELTHGDKKTTVIEEAVAPHMK